MKTFLLGSVLLMASACYGVQDTPEVAAAKAAHFAVHAHIAAHAAPAPTAHHWGGGHYEAPVQKWNGPIHIPQIQKGVPVETAEVQHAKAAHAAAYAKVAAQPHYAPAPYHAPVVHAPAYHSAPAAYAGAHHGGGAWHGPQHVPVIHNGVPVETPEVQHAKAAHLNALAKADASSNAHGHGDDGSYKPHLYESAHH
ncbi:pupal cuticle protein-like [Aedes aegypti]|uniref:Uncharacterized protein n=1 Tax=Aedes aegypti TaxID=7159 RepID=A0A6I8U4S2_AEDAE|nr:pupal cuticle protein-like [Aedes aegypti]XP_021711991.1 pupal cuticle protein-like [Aedes aegypti]